MPTPTSYTYSVSANFPNGRVDVDALEEQIRSEAAIVVALDAVTVAGDTVTVTFRDALDAAQKTALDAVVAAHDGSPPPGGGVSELGNEVVALEARQPDGVALFALEGRMGKEVIFVSPNLADPTTWYSTSVRVVNAQLQDTGDGVTFAAPDANLIDLEHGRVFDEEGIVEAQKAENPNDPHGYAVVVEEQQADGSWVALTPRPPFASLGGDYVVDYAAGRFTFSANKAGKALRASYSKKVDSTWVLRPKPGRALVIEKAEVQFSADAVMSGTLDFEVYGFADYFAPNLGLPSGTKVPIARTRYKTIDQVIDEAVAAYPQIPAMPGQRGYTQSRNVFQFHYGTVRTLYASLGMELRLRIEGDEPFLGERTTATFYCVSKDDPGASAALALISG